MKHQHMKFNFVRTIELSLISRDFAQPLMFFWMAFEIDKVWHKLFEQFTIEKM